MAFPLIEIITEYPARFLSLTVLPGVPPDERAFDRLGGLKGIPVAVFVGGEDPEWVRASQETKQKLDGRGFTGPVRAQKSKNLAAMNLQVERVQGTFFLAPQKSALSPFP